MATVSLKPRLLDNLLESQLLSGFCWEELMLVAVHRMLSSTELVGALEKEHIANTPARVVKAYKEYMHGVNMDLDKVFTMFTAKHSEMVIVKDILVNSLCQHHLLPFFGKASFGYIPDKKIIGLSKIPRLIDIVSGRPQIQEDLGGMVVEEFNKRVQPIGCGVVIEAVHTCMSCRGARANGVTTRTISLLGTFRHSPSAKQEFLESIR